MPAPDERDEVLEAFREGRRAIADFGLRRTLVFVRVRHWYTGSAPPWARATARGVGYPVDVETEVVPTPRVRDLSVQYVMASGGRYRLGDVRVDKITPRNEPSTGVELWPFTRASVAADEERHVLLLERSGTPWHVREGTARLLTPGPYDEASAVVCANALRTAYPGHWTDAYAHIVPSAAPAPGVAATGWASALTLANVLRAAWVAHRADMAAHPEADGYPVAAPVAADNQSTLVLLHGLLRVFLSHVAPGGVSEAEVVEAHADRAFSHSLIVRPTRRTP